MRRTCTLRHACVSGVAEKRCGIGLEREKVRAEEALFKTAPDEMKTFYKIIIGALACVASLAAPTHVVRCAV